MSLIVMGAWLMFSLFKGMEGACFDCRKAAGYTAKDNGAHTVRVKTCSVCGEVKGILPSRHWHKREG